MDKVSIISLIFQSTVYAEHCYNSVMKYTPEIASGDAEFFFVANDATEEVINFLKERGYPFIVKDNPHYTEDEKFRQGHAFPEYGGRVYMGYNYGIQQAQNPIVVWINSDNCFSPGWLGNLKKRLTPKTIVSPRMIQPQWFRNPINNSECEIMQFGTGPRNFNENGFIAKVNEISTDSESIGNAFFPAMVYKYNVKLVGYFPEGNINNGDFNNILMTGDTLFYKKLGLIGVNHITSNDSIIYHFNEGEKYLK